MTQELDSVQLSGLFLKHPDELRSDDLPLLLRIADSGQLVQKAVHCIYVNQICPQLMAEHLNHLFRFALPQKAMVDVNTGELASHRPDEQHRHH